MLVLAGGIAIGSAIWGVLAGWSLMGSQLIAAAVLLLGLPTSRRWQLGVVHGLDLRPATPTEPIVVLNPDAAGRPGARDRQLPGARRPPTPSSR